MVQKPSAVVVLVSDSERRVLAVSRKGNLADLGLPGGKVDPSDADPLAATCREFWEEIGVRVQPEELEFVYERTDPASGLVAWCYALKASALKEPPRAVEPNTWVGWVTPERLLEPTNLFHQYNRGLFEHLEWL